jgi:undecaprenyl diphosphate synthase
MIQSTSDLLHVAIIMDGNGRWAQARHLPRVEGHEAGAAALRRVVEAAPDCGIGILTVYAFSSDNWKRPAAEVAALMRLFARSLAEETTRATAEGLRISVIGRRDRLSRPLKTAIMATERATRGGKRLHLRLAIDYSSRHAIQHNAVGPDVDLVIRTSGEQRLSDFLLWESAYAELYFTRVLWPDFGREDLERALNDFRSRTRRFGALPECDTVRAV